MSQSTGGCTGTKVPRTTKSCELQYNVETKRDLIGQDGLMAIAGGPLLKDQARRVLGQKCPSEVQNIQGAIGTTCQLGRKVIGYHRKTDYRRRSHNCYNGPGQEGRQRLAKYQSRLGSDEQNRNRRQY